MEPWLGLEIGISQGQRSGSSPVFALFQAVESWSSSATV
jgi:hypothetical protein